MPWRGTVQVMSSLLEFRVSGLHVGSRGQGLGPLEIPKVFANKESSICGAGHTRRPHACTHSFVDGTP